MKETRADTQRALLQATGLHVLLFALMFAGLHWTRSNMVEPPQGDPIEADLVDPSALSAAMQRALKREPAKLPKPVVEPDPAPPEPVQDPLPTPIAEQVPPAPVLEPDTVEQEKVQRDAISPEVAKVPREQEAKRKQPPQVDLDAQKQQQQAELKRQKQIIEIQQKREQATRDRINAEMRAMQLADAKAQQTADISRAAPPPGNRGTNPDLLAKYSAALQQAILRQWIRPESVQLGQRCQLSIRQLPGGQVVDVTFTGSCPFDELGRQSVERAVLKASPLPYAGFEDVFARTLTLNFVAEGD